MQVRIMTTLSACMIVKNEEEMLPRCLRSIQPYVDEIILVDTGSTDRTMDIARQFGAKIYEHPWQNDFGLHRNQSIGYSTGDWMLIIDADEELLDPEIDKKEFMRRFDLLPNEVSALVCIIEEVGHDAQWIGSRIFRKGRSLQYKNYVHNKPNIEGGVVATNIRIRHYGYSLSPEKMKAKIKRSVALLQKRLKDDPGDYDAMFYMAKYAMADKKHEEVIKWGTKCLSIFPFNGPMSLGYYGALYFMIGQSHLRSNRPDDAYCWFMKGLSFYPDDIDLNFVMAILGYLTMRDDLLMKYGNKYLEMIDHLDEPMSDLKFRQSLPPILTTTRMVNYSHPRFKEMLKGWLSKID